MRLGDYVGCAGVGARPACAPLSAWERACYVCSDRDFAGQWQFRLCPLSVLNPLSSPDRACRPGRRFTFERTAACSDPTRSGDSAGIRPPARSFPRLPQPPHRSRGQPLSLRDPRRAAPSWEAARAPSGPAKRSHTPRRFFRTPALARQCAQFELNTRSARPLLRRTGSVNRRRSRSRRGVVGADRFRDTPIIPR